jgi:hypothetical protein
MPKTPRARKSIGEGDGSLISSRLKPQQHLSKLCENIGGGTMSRWLDYYTRPSPRGTGTQPLSPFGAD